jgi:hypothetical protein
MESLAAHSRKLAVGGAPRSPRAIRLALAVKAALVFALIALADERASAMLVALAPLALIAAEAVRHLSGLDTPEDG